MQTNYLQEFRPTYRQASESFKERIANLMIIEFPSCFSTVLDNEAANVLFFELKVKRDQWEVNVHRDPPRRTDTVRAQELRKQIATYVDLGIIEPSTATAYVLAHS